MVANKETRTYSGKSISKKHPRRHVRHVSPSAASSVTTQACAFLDQRTVINIGYPPYGRVGDCVLTSQNGSPGTAQNNAQAANTAAQVRLHSTHGGIGGINLLGSLDRSSTEEKGIGPAARASEMNVENTVSFMSMGVECDRRV